MAEKEKTPVPAKAAPQAESVYTAAELADGHDAFQASREIVVTALRLAGKESATRREAEAIIRRFAEKEV